MARFLKLDKDENLKCDKEIKNFLNPDYIYIPFYNNYKLLKKNHDKVTLDEPIFDNDNQLIFSSVSGNIVSLNEMNVNQEKVKCICIANDFMENKAIKKSVKNINKYSKEEFIDLIHKYTSIREDFESKNLIISGIDYELYEENLSKLISSYSDNILDTVDALIKILDINKCVMVVKDNDTDNVVNLLNLIGTYPNINLKLMADLYPIGNKMILKDELFNNDAIFLDVNDVFNIYKVLRKNKPVTEKLITVSGNMINKPKIVNVKIGTSVKELLDKNFKIKGDDYHLVINGLISGYEVNDDDMIITENIRSIFVTSKVFNETMPCIRCGLCVKHCPVGANPVTGYKMDKCIKCGACKYVCPSNISLGEKNE